MPRTIRFHLDENCSLAIAHGLRRRGVDVTSSPEAGLLGAGDDTQLAYVVTEGRLIFTEDQDFLRIHAMGTPHPGVAYCRQKTRTVGQIVRGLLLIWERYEPDEVRNTVRYL
jgi:predicted nuclease of predicted toxin-antitoxin system